MDINPCKQCLTYSMCKHRYESLAFRSITKEDALMVLAMDCSWLLKCLKQQLNEVRSFDIIYNPLIDRYMDFLYNRQFLERVKENELSM